MSILGDILKSITKPGRDVAELSRLVSTVRQMDPSINKDLTSLEKRLKAQQKTEQYTPKYQTQEEQLGTFLRPGETALRNAATVGAFAAPVGAVGNIASRAGAGALGGALGSYGMTPITEDTNLMKILGGAALGGTVGAAIGGVERGLMSKAQKTVPSKVSDFGLFEGRGKSIGLDSNKLASKRGINVTSSAQGKKVIRSYFDTMDSLGLPTQTSQLASQSSDDALRILNEQFNGVLTNADNAVTFSSKDTANIVNKINSAFKNNPKITSNAQYQELIGDLLSLGESYSPSQLNMIREKARELVNWSTGSKAAVSQRATSQVFSVIDDFFKSKIGGTSEVLGKMKDIYTVRPVFQAKAPTAGSIKIGTASTNVAVPSFAIQERIPSAAGEALQKGIRMPQVSPEVLANIGNAGIFGTRLGQALGQEQAPMQPQVEQPMSQQVQPDTTGINLMLAQGILSGQITSAEANAVLSLLGMSGMGGEELSANQSKAQALQGSLDSLKSVWEQSSGVARTMQTLGLNIGTGARSLKQAKMSTAEDLGRLQSQGAITPAERVEFMARLPNIWDSPEVVEQKFASIQNIINSY